MGPELPATDAIHYYGSIACMGFFVASNKYPILVQENPMDEGPSGFTDVECPMAHLRPHPWRTFERYHQAARDAVRKLDCGGDHGESG